MSDQCDWEVDAISVGPTVCGRPVTATVLMPDGFPRGLCGTHKNVAVNKWGAEEVDDA